MPRPFFLVVLTIDPHSPYAPPLRFDRYGGDYAGRAPGGKGWLEREELIGISSCAFAMSDK